jgi:hypothetical protein
MVQTPLSTYCGWNLRARGFGHGAMHEFSGSYIPLPETPEERDMTGDPRRPDPRALSERRNLRSRDHRGGASKRR